MKQTFCVYGKVKGKGRPRFTQSGRVYTPQQTLAYENYVKWIWTQSGGATREGNVFVDIVVYVTPPKSLSKKKREAILGTPYPHKPDVDNVAKIILDALNNGLAYRDDAQVVDLRVRKMYANEDKCVVSVVDLNENWEEA